MEFQDSLPDRQSWIAKNLSKMQAKLQAKAEAKLARAANNPSIRRDARQLKRYITRKNKLLKYTIWLIIIK